MKYLTLSFISFLALMTFIATLNWLIDPFAMYWSPQLNNINMIKPESGKRSRIAKAYQIENVKPQILIVGNSRVEMGLNPDHQVFNKKRVYNQGMPGASVAMQVDYAINAIMLDTDIEEIFVAVDFLDFLIDTSRSQKTSSSYQFRLSNLDDGSSHASLLRLKEKTGLIFSIDALIASITTITQQKSLVNSTKPNGFNNPLSYIQIMNTEGIKPLFKQKLAEISTRIEKDTLKIVTQPKPVYSPVYSHIGRLIEVAKRNNIKLTFFINPYHMSYLQTLSDNQQWSNFQLWKTTLVKYLAAKQGSDFALWDFSLSNNYINEPVDIDNAKKQMKWFWEPAHYKEALGDLLLLKLNEENKLNNTFGIQLTENNIQHVLDENAQALNASKAQWKALKSQLQL